MSKKIFSAQDWENVPSEIQQIHTPRIAPIYNKVCLLYTSDAADEL